MEKLNLSSPWVTYVNEMKALFEQDPQITIIYYDEDYTVKLFVESDAKVNALQQLLPETKEFGNVTLKIEVVPANTNAVDPNVALFAAAFEGNPVLEEVRSISSVIGTFNYAVFKKEVVQFYNDQLDDLHGNKSTLYQEIAKDVLGQKEGIFYCTDIAD